MCGLWYVSCMGTVCLCADRVADNVVQAANSQHALVCLMVVAEEEGGAQEAGQQRGQEGALHLRPQ